MTAPTEQGWYWYLSDRDAKAYPMAVLPYLGRLMAWSIDGSRTPLSAFNGFWLPFDVAPTYAEFLTGATCQ